MTMSQFDFESSLRIRRDSNPARSYLWAVIMPDLLSAPAEVDSSSVKAAQSDFENIATRGIDMTMLSAVVTGINTPFFTYDTDKVAERGRFWHKAKHYDISNLSITFEEQETGLVWGYLNNWQKLINNSNGQRNPPYFYKRDIKFLRLDMTKNVFQEFVYGNAFISEIASISNEYNTSSPVQYTATFTCDPIKEVSTISGADLNQRLESAYQVLGNIEIPYDRFNSFGVPSPTIANLLNSIARRSF